MNESRKVPRVPGNNFLQFDIRRVPSRLPPRVALFKFFSIDYKHPHTFLSVMELDHFVQSHASEPRNKRKGHLANRHRHRQHTRPATTPHQRQRRQQDESGRDYHSTAKKCNLTFLISSSTSFVVPGIQSLLLLLITPHPSQSLIPSFPSYSDPTKSFSPLSMDPHLQQRHVTHPNLRQ
jgi:hypothetical protein